MNTPMRGPADSKGYEVDLPEGLNSDVDGRVTSYWKPRTETVLQFSSYRRVEGDQIGSQERAKDRIAHDKLGRVAKVDLRPEACPDCTVFACVDASLFRWIYCYAVWPDLAITITVIGPDADFDREAGWAITAIRSIRLK